MDDQSCFSPQRAPASRLLVANLEGVEVVFDQSGLNRSSREQPDRTFPCRYAGCNVACKRTYERDRHEQTKHKQSKNLFCPIGKCRCSRDADELAEVLSNADFYSWKDDGNFWASMREGMKTEILKQRSSHAGNLGEYSKARLLGFARRDKVLKHIQKAHKDIDTTAEDFAIERDALVGEPIFAEVQAFWVGTSSYWFRVYLGRLLRTDGSWTGWFGKYRADVEAAGFQQWTETGKRDYELLKKKDGYEDVLPWEASAILQQRNVAAAQESRERINHTQPEHTKTQTSNPQQDSSLTYPSGDTAESSMQLWSTQASDPEDLTTPYANHLVGYGNGCPISHSLAHAADVADVSLTPGQIGGSPSTDSAPLAPIFHFGESLAPNLISPMAASAGPAFGAAQDGSLWPGDLEYSNLVPALPILPWADSDFGADAVADAEINFDCGGFEALPQWQQEGAGEQGVGEPGAELGDEFNCDFGEFLELREWQPEGSGEHGEHEPRGEADSYSGLGKRSFSQL